MSISKRNISVFLLIFFCLFITVKANDNSFVDEYHSSSNSKERRDMIHDMGKFLPRSGESVESWIPSLLKTALNDESPVVVEQAANQIGNFRLESLIDELIEIYENADKLFGSCGYTHRVQFALIPAIGKIKSPKSTEFLKSKIREDNGSHFGEFIIKAIKENGDKSLLEDLQEYKEKMNAKIKVAKQKGYDEIVYSRLLAYIKLAEKAEDEVLGREVK